MKMVQVGYIYALTDPRDGQIRYVGQTSVALSSRLASHMRDAGCQRYQFHRVRWIRALVTNGLRPSIVRLTEVPLSMLDSAERFWIKTLRGWGARLTNSTDGGDGVTMTSEIRHRISAAKTGVSPTARHIEKLRCAAFRRWSDPAERRKQSERRKLKPLDFGAGGA